LLARRAQHAFRSLEPVDGAYTWAFAMPGLFDPLPFPAVLLLTLTAGCGASANNFRPGTVPQGQGAVVGRIQVFKGDSEVTSACSVSFADEEDEQKSNYSLDASGWVFLSVEGGTTYLRSVNCAVWNGLAYGTRALRFKAAWNKTTYFGHVRFYLANRDLEITLGAVASGAATIPITSVAEAAIASSVAVGADAARATLDEGANKVVAWNDPRAMAAEYARRYQRAPELITDLVLEPPAEEPQAKFVRRGDVISASFTLGDLHLTWLGLVRSQSPWVGFRAWQQVPKPTLEACHEAVLLLDDKPLPLPLIHDVKPSGMGVIESVGVRTDVATLKAVASAKAVELRLCSVSRKLPADVASVAGDVATEYETALAALPQNSEPGREPPAATAPAAAAPPAAEAE